MDSSQPVNRESVDEQRDRRGDRRWAAAGGVAAAAVGFGGMAIVGTATAFEARRLLDSLLPTVRFAASAYVAGGITVLALMLTLITFAMSHELEFRATYFKRIREIAAMTTIVIVGSVLLLLFLSFPLSEAEVQPGYYVWVYYAVLLGAAVSGGLFISVVLMLMYAVQGLIGVAEDAASSDLVTTGDDQPAQAQDNGHGPSPPESGRRGQTVSSSSTEKAST